MNRVPHDTPESGTGYSFRQILLANLVAFVFYLFFWYGAWPVIVDLHAPTRCDRSLEYSLARALQLEEASFESDVRQIVESKNRAHPSCRIEDFQVHDGRPDEVEVSFVHLARFLSWDIRMRRSIEVPLSIE